MKALVLKGTTLSYYREKDTDLILWMAGKRHTEKLRKCAAEQNGGKAPTVSSDLELAISAVELFRKMPRSEFEEEEDALVDRLRKKFSGNYRKKQKDNRKAKLGSFMVPSAIRGAVTYPPPQETSEENFQQLIIILRRLGVIPQTSQNGQAGDGQKVNSQDAES
jgi:hypothetical protein